MNSSWNDSNDNVLWHNSNKNASSNNRYNEIGNNANRNLSSNNRYNQISYNANRNASSNNRYNQISYNSNMDVSSNNKYNQIGNNANRNTSSNNRYNQISYNLNRNVSSNSLYNKTAVNKPNNKIIIASIICICVLSSVVFAFYSKAKKKNNTDNSIDNSTEMVNSNSNIEDTWIVDDELVEENTSNGDMESMEDNGYSTDSEEEIRESTTDEKVLTGSADITETEKPVETTIRPIETTIRPVATTNPTEIITPVATISPTIAPVAPPAPIVTPRPVVTPIPTATPRPVVTEYASLVTQYTEKDYNGQIVYILSNSDNRYYSVSELQSLTKEQLRFARNEIFARRGGKFTSSDLQQYFSSRSWYIPIRNATDFEDKDLNIYEIENIKLIQEVEKSR